MTFGEFRKSAAGTGTVVPPGLSPALQALWHEAHGDWEQAHGIAQNDQTPEGSWVHAYLHRREGDAGNAGYWYARAGRPAVETAAEEEWTSIARALLVKPLGDRGLPCGA